MIKIDKKGPPRDVRGDRKTENKAVRFMTIAPPTVMTFRRSISKMTSSIFSLHLGKHPRLGRIETVCLPTDPVTFRADMSKQGENL